MKIRKKKDEEYEIQTHDKKLRESVTRNNLVPSLTKWSPHSLPIMVLILGVVETNMNSLTGNQYPKQTQML